MSVLRQSHHVPDLRSKLRATPLLPGTTDREYPCRMAPAREIDALPSKTVGRRREDLRWLVVHEAEHVCPGRELTEASGEQGLLFA